MIKKILTIILCIALICPTISFAASDEEKSFEIAEYNEAFHFLFSLGIINYENEAIETNDWTITRGEFIHLVLSCLGYLDDAQAINYTNNPFLDVHSENPYYESILYASSIGMLGDDFGAFFQPDTTLTMDFASVIGANLTGRDVYVSDRKTYLNVATSAKLFTNVECYGNGEISRGGALMLIKNILTVELVTYSAITSNGDKIGIKVEENANLLSSVLNYKRHRGILTSDGVTTIYGSAPEPGDVTINGVSYSCIYANITGMAGKYVEYYIVDHEDEPTVKYVEEYRNSVFTINADSVLSFNSSAMSYNVRIGNKSRSIGLNKNNVYVSYNNEPYFDFNYMHPQKGSVTFIDHNSDNVYDVVIILEYTNTVVDYYSAYTETIYDVDSRKDSVTNKDIDHIDLSDARNVFLNNSGNVAIEPGKLEKYCVLSVFKSSNGKRIQMLASSRKVTGVFSSYDSGEPVITIGDEDFKLSQDMRFDLQTLDLGKQYTFYLDFSGAVAYVTSEAGTMAYLLDGGRYRRQIEIALVDEQSGKYNVCNLADKVRYRTPSVNVRVKENELFDDYLTDGAGNFNRTMALIFFNDEGEVKEIITAMDILSYDQVFSAPEYPLYNLDYLSSQRPDYSGGSGSNFEYKGSGDHLNGWLVIGSGAKVFYLPEDSAPIDDEDAVAVKSVDSMSNGNTVTFDGFYTKDLNDVPVRYMIRRATASNDATIGKAWPYVVTDIVGCCTDKLGDTYRLTLVGSSSKITLYTKDESVILKENFSSDTDPNLVSPEKTKVEEGDIIYYSTDASGNINSILLLWDSRYNLLEENVERFGKKTSIDDPTESWMNTTAKWKKTTTTGGILKRKSGDILEISIDETDSVTSENIIQRVSWGKSMKTVLIEFSGKKVTATYETISATDLVPGDRIVLSINDSGMCRLGVVYRKVN